MRMVYVSYFEACPLSGKSARSQSRKSSLMSQLCQRIVLVHELGKLGTSEEFFYGCRYRPDVHQRLRRSYIYILNSHSFFDYSLHSGKSYSELILQQFAYSSQPSVAQMVNIVYGADAVIQVQYITDRGYDVFYYNVLRRKIILSVRQHLFDLFLAAAGVQYLSEHRIEYLVGHLQV